MKKTETGSPEKSIWLKKDKSEQNRPKIERKERWASSIELLPPKKGLFDNLYETLSRRAFGSYPVFNVVSLAPIGKLITQKMRFKRYRPCRCC